MTGACSSVFYNQFLFCVNNTLKYKNYENTGKHNRNHKHLQPYHS